MSDPDPQPIVVRGVRRWLYVLLGCFFTFLAILGVALPVLPTTPFLILASFFFIRSSPALNARLLRSRLFGPMLRDWHKHRGVRIHVKVLVLLLIPLMVATSIVVGGLNVWLAVLVIALGLVGMYVVLRLPVVRDRTILLSEPRPLLSGRSSPDPLPPGRGSDSLGAS